MHLLRDDNKKSHAQHLLGDFEDSQETDAAQNGHAQRRHDVRFGEDHFDDAADDDETIEAVKQRHEITLKGI